MTIETQFDVPLVAAQALREKQIQQYYRPVIAVHKWFARRPGSLFRALTLAEFGDAPLAELYFTANDFAGRKVADPFMGGGIPLLEANRVGCEVLGFDINPMSAWIVREEMEPLDIASYQEEANRLLSQLRHDIGHLYVTDCPQYGERNVPVKCFLWIKVLVCEVCQSDIDLFPGYRVADNLRHTHRVLACPECGDLNDVEGFSHPGSCRNCQGELKAQGPAVRGKCLCPRCGHTNTYPRPGDNPLRHRLFAMEYYNPYRKANHKGRFFKKPDDCDLQRMAEAESRLRKLRTRFVPDVAIPEGDETRRLHQWGYHRYCDMFNPRQLLGLELSGRLIAEIKDTRLRNALATNMSDLLRYQNMLCRYDTRTLKALDIFSIHGFPVGQVQCESNLLGIVNADGANVGSGGWTNIVSKYAKAKLYCAEPFEVKKRGRRNVLVPIEGEAIGTTGKETQPQSIVLHCADSTTVQLPRNSLDAVFTDPPYFSNVQYGELMDFCYVWLRRLVGKEPEGFGLPSTRTRGELTGNITRAQGLAEFTAGLARVYRRMAEAMKPGAPLAFTYHHNRLKAYQAIGVAILDAGLTCSATLPCPTEMKGSIHIHGTVSSIVDTIFVCRKTGAVPQFSLFSTPEALESVMAHDLAQLVKGGYTPTIGDMRCVLYGHLTRMAVWNLRKSWNCRASTEEKLDIFARALNALPDPDPCLSKLQLDSCAPLFTESPSFPTSTQQGMNDAIAF